MLNIEKRVKEIDFNYRPILNIPPNILFGTEIEFAQELFIEVIKKIKEFNKTDNRKYHTLPAHYGCFYDYSKWKCKEDLTVINLDKNNQLHGGEVQSPIISNKKEYFEALSEICDILTNMPNIKINKKCGLHIHVDRTIYGNDAKTFLRLLKLWMLFEDVIYRFSYGETYTPRNYMYRFVKPINKRIYKNLNELSKYQDETYDKIIKDFRYKSQGISFFYTGEDIQKILNTIEIRTFNGTLNKTIIQNDINFVINLLLYAVSDSYDEEYIDYEIKRFEPIAFKNFEIKNTTKALTLSNLIFKDELDMLYFMKQYLKQFRQEELIDKKNIL